MKDTNFSFFLDSLQLKRIFDFKQDISKNGLAMLQEYGYLKQNEELISAYEGFIQDILYEIPQYTIQLEDDEGCADWSIADGFKINILLSTDVYTVFKIHKDIYTNYKKEFEDWLKEISSEDYLISGKFNDYMDMLEGYDVAKAISIFLIFLVEKKISKDIFSYIKSEFIKCAETAIYGYD